ncbi:MULTISPECIES: hypothetical protein [unclassified Mesorhizobium]|nr:MULTISPECIES: hypothetical protein [unclassified Mesorhizobium]
MYTYPGRGHFFTDGELPDFDPAGTDPSGWGDEAAGRSIVVTED